VAVDEFTSVVVVLGVEMAELFTAFPTVPALLRSKHLLPHAARRAHPVRVPRASKNRELDQHAS
jgi:hypothetical protein